LAKALTHIHAQGFRSLREVDINPGRLTVLIGANGSGKSNLLSLLRMIPLIRTQSLRRFVGDAGGASALLHYGPKVTQQIAVRLEFSQEGGENAYDIRLGYAANDALIFRDELVEHRAAATAPFVPVSLGTGHAESRLEIDANEPGHQTSKNVRWWLKRMNFFHFHDTSLTAPLRQMSRQEDTRFLRSDGSNLAAYLRALELGETASDHAAWVRITGLVRQVAPFIKSLQPRLVVPHAPTVSAVQLDWTDERDEIFGAHHLSDGTLRALALITALAQPAERLPAFISIDEPELGLHPAAIAVLASLMRSVSSRCQVLLATQSPALLDFFEPEEVVVVERSQGATTFQRLDPQALEKWREDYTLSQLYDMNVLGGRP
jgi:predicted ATPase